MFPRFLLDSDDDWQEGVRAWLYPRLHPFLTPFGGYGVGHTAVNQYIGKFSEGEESIELELVDAGFRRNPIACFKSLPDGRKSEGSWVLIPEDAPDHVAPGMQLHVTMFKRADGQKGREMYAHYEDDWRSAPVAHLRAKNFSAAAGVDIARDYLDERTFLVREE
ncbi:hypothetical protein HRTV-14_gp34 [Halorubrum phage HRTV-14]|uniref:Uncharacterized protein n=1 Tax=Halorubrum phage HRTV-14 TaxID=2877994 RepID=A0AAE8XS15_9CAUD|nr:hypothetical protein HRTV-14_gp34 [Halorubrum phage HRTV-14]